MGIFLLLDAMELGTHRIVDELLGSVGDQMQELHGAGRVDFVSCVARLVIVGMQAGEEECRRLGHNQLDLNVFGNNSAAIGLYESLGYALLSQQMRKEL